LTDDFNGYSLQGLIVISFEEAQQIIKENAISIAVEKVPIIKALNKFLAEDIFSDTDIPTFNKSAMDGFACRKSDLANELTVIDTIPAGKTPVSAIDKNECMRIMTGGMVPEGPDFVVQIENTIELSSRKIKCTKIPSSSNICFIGEDIKKGQKVLEKNTCLNL